MRLSILYNSHAFKCSLEEAEPTWRGRLNLKHLPALDSVLAQREKEWLYEHEKDCASLWVYPLIKITAVRQVCMSLHLLQSEHEDKTSVQCRMMPNNHGHILFSFVVRKNLKTSKLSPMADNAITRGCIGGLRSLVYICGATSKPILLMNKVIFFPFSMLDLCLLISI